MVNNKWLNTAEQLSIAAAVAGTVAAEVTRQTIFVSAPLSFALCLSLLNRSRAQQTNQQSVTTELGQLRQDLSQLDQKVWQDVESLRERLLSLPTTPEPMDLNQIQGFVASIQTELETRLAPLQTIDMGVIHAGMTQLQTEVSELQANMDDLISQPLEIVTPDLSQIQTQISHLHQRVEATSQGNSHIEDRLTELQGAIAQLHSPIETDLMPLLDAKLEERLSELRHSIAHLEAQTPPPELAPLIDLHLDTRLAEIRSALPLTAPISEPIVEPNLLVSELRQLQQRQDNLEQEIVKAVRTELQTHFSLLAEVGFNSIHQGIAGLQTEMGQMQTELQALAQLSEGIANQPPVDLTALQTEIIDLHQKMAHMPAAFDPAPLEQRLDELKTVIDRLEAEAEQSPLKQDLTVFFSAMRSLYNHQTAALS